MKKAMLMILLSLVISLVHCGGGGNISLVKKGLLDFDKSKTVGEAFDNYKYFKGLKWDSFKSEDERDIVEVIAEYNIEKALKAMEAMELENIKAVRRGFDKIKKVIVTFQFRINKDNTFEVHWYGAKYYGKNGKKVEKNLSSESDITNVLEGIYDNEPDI
ncbi:MAG: hypothetical protein IEMM0008_0188 [bacterium]|nr:MAG: hypothetical protein IEMM0008_0188 [bacterium]